MQRILSSASRIFGRSGFRGASMGQVARDAGVSKGLLHYHFRSKEHLLIEAQRATFKQIHTRFIERANRGETGIDSGLAGIDALWTAIRDLAAWAPFMVRTMGVSCDQGPVRDAAQQFQSEAMTLLEQGINHILAADAERLQIPPQRLAVLIRTTLRGLVVELAHAASPEELAEVDQAYADFRHLMSQALFTRHGPSGARP